MWRGFQDLQVAVRALDSFEHASLLDPCSCEVELNAPSAVNFVPRSVPP